MSPEISLGCLLALHRLLYLPHPKRDDIYNGFLEAGSSLEYECLTPLFKYIEPSDLKRAEEDIKAAQRGGIKIITLFDEAYPFRSVSPLPPVIFMKGEMRLDNTHIAFVGSRKATQYGRETVGKLISGLSEYGVTIVSGLAYGIDAASHRAAIAEGMATVAVLGCGIDVMYPAGNRDLFEKIPKNGALISEFPLGMPPYKSNFPLRNRLISAISAGVVVIEAEPKSGSLITAKWALDQGKDLFAVPGNIDRAMSKGTNYLIKNGAYLVDDAADIVGVLGLKRSCQKDQKKKAGQDGKDSDTELVDKFFNGEITLEELALNLDMGVQETLCMLTEAETKRRR